MNPRIQHLIKQPFEVTLEDVSILQEEIVKYPYFSTLRTLLLYGLNSSEHPTYEEELKKTSIYSYSRVALYQYLQKQPPINVHDEIGEKSEESNQEIVAIENSESISERNSEDFTAKKMSFSEWLSVAENKNSPRSFQDEREIKYKLIDEFIEKSPKISPISKLENQESSSQLNSSIEYSDLMTETLAQIYAEQKKFDKAIRAYKILSIKYPEKKEIFLTKIEEIEKLK